MDNRLKNIKEELDPFISPNAFFTEEDKKAVRQKIRNKEVTKSKQNRLFPLIMSFAAVAVFFFLIGGFMGDRLGINPRDSKNAQKGELITAPHSKEIVVKFDPARVREGVQYGNLTVESVSPSVRYFPDSPFQAVFTGDVTLSGIFVYPGESEDIIFHPDVESAAKLPAPKGVKRNPKIMFSNYMENKEQILQLLKLSAGDKVTGTVTISYYQVDYRKTGEQVDYADIVAINGTQLNQAETGNTGVLNEIPITYDIISDDSIPIYEHFYKTGDDEVLSRNNPEGIFLMFWQAFALNHTVTMYELMNKDTNHIPDYQTFVETDYEQKAKTLQTEFEKIKANLNNLNIEIEGDSATVGVKGEQQFVLKKDKSGIWKFQYFF
jgi:hypothetical protein